jgi:Cof subfamily protein (haloacid dehalogenase superfamily)
MKTKAIFFDIDGTLVSFKTHSIPASTKKAIYQLKKKGIKVIISTGRAFRNIDNLEDLEFDGFITANGSCCLDPKGEIIVQYLLSKENLGNLAYFLEEKPFPCTFMTNKGNFISCTDDLTRSVYQLVNLPTPPVKSVFEIIGHDVFQLSAFINRELETKLLTHILTDCEGSRWHPSFVDFNAKNCNKATGMDNFLTYFDIDREHTMVFGDGGNDISILKHAAIGIAMGNANDEVKAAANYVTDSVDEDGISNALKYFNIL